ncbi:MAG: DNA-binding protein WhiA [Clostridia bacterium]|nr:DNA-binding protein WhiA [Clostridia bacterium]MBO7504139.1 DNA-binding protein WhiA [Clostridia bacterium]
MSYTETVRHELLHTDVRKKCCRETELWLFAYLALSAGGGEKGGVCEAGKLKGGPRNPLNRPDALSRITYLAEKVTGAAPGNTEKPETEDPVKAAVDYFKSKNDAEADAEIFLRRIKSDCCRAAALRVFFSVAGTVSEPDKSKCYAEIYFDTRELAKAYADILASFGIAAGVSQRRAKFVCYIKKAESVSDLLTVIGLPGESIKFQVAKTEREVSNNVNRMMNCDIANIEKARAHAAAEIAAIKRIKSRGMYSGLPESLKSVAELRMEYPEANHAELGAMLIPAVSHSTVSLRMKKIIELAD